MLLGKPRGRGGGRGVQGFPPGRGDLKGPRNHCAEPLPLLPLLFGGRGARLVLGDVWQLALRGGTPTCDLGHFPTPVGSVRPPWLTLNDSDPVPERASGEACALWPRSL